MIGTMLLMAKHQRRRRSTVAKKPIKKENWLNAYWRPTAAVVYLVICLCDFIIFPWVFGLRAPSAHEMALAVKDLDPQVAAVLAAPRAQWQPLTLMGSGLFHVAFGAILGISAWTRGAAHIETIRNNALTDYDQMADPNQHNPNQYNQYNPNQYNQANQNYNYQQTQNYSANPGPQYNRHTPDSSEQVDNPDAT